MTMLLAPLKKQAAEKAAGRPGRGRRAVRPNPRRQ